MKVYVAVLAIAAFIACVSAAVLPEESYNGPDHDIVLIDESEKRPQFQAHESDDEIVIPESAKDEEAVAVQPHIRRRRFTCDVFSFSSKWVTPNHAACALKCVGKGRKGGHCEGQNCKCRDGSWIH